MNYQKIYNQIIERAITENRIKRKDIYYEQHHIIPRCLGGTDDIQNLILLTAREHFISHKLLCEIYPDQKKLIFAYWMMANKTSNKQYDRNYNISSHEYERLKILFSNTSSENNKGKPSPLKGKKRGPLSDEHKQKLRAANLGRVMTTEQKAIVSAANKGKVISEETKQKISNALKGIPKSKETKMKMKLAQQSRFNKSC